MTVHIEDILLFAIAQKGDQYVYGTEVNPLHPDSDKWDCSELVQISCEVGGLQNVPDGAANQWNWVNQHSLSIPSTQFLHKRGALLFIVEGRSVGHVVFDLGDGKHTMEAKGKAYGVNVFNSTPTRFQHGGLIPGVDYSPRQPLPPAPPASATPKSSWPGHTLQKGSNEPAVVLLQQKMINIGSHLTHGADGKYGDETTTNVRWWQQMFNNQGAHLDVTGSVDRPFWDELFKR